MAQAANRTNPCKERATGCLGVLVGHSTRCVHCARVHNDRENARRRKRRKECACWVCGAEAVKVQGVYQATCAAHQHYRAEMKRGA